MFDVRAEFSALKQNEAISEQEIVIQGIENAVYDDEDDKEND